MTRQPHRRHRWLRWTGGTLVALIVVVIGGLAIDAHLTTAPAMLALPKVVGAGPPRSAVPSMDGVWRAGSGSIVGWRAQQVLAAQDSTLTGRTGKVWGSITIAGGTVASGSFSVDMAALTANESPTTQRTVFDVSADPTATLVLTRPIALGAIPAEGTIDRYSASGTLDLHGVTRPVQFTVSTERAGSNIDLLADITLPFGEWGISVQGVPFLADIRSPAVIEVLLHLTQATSNQPSVAAKR